jgi:DNA polymerase
VPYLKRQLAVLDPAVVATLGRFSMGYFRPGERITQIHGTAVPADAETGARNALSYALYHPAAALRSTEVERQSYVDVAGLPAALTDSRRRRSQHESQAPAGLAAVAAAASATATVTPPADEPTLF